MSAASSVGTAARPPLSMAAFVRDIVAAADRFGRDDLDRARAAMAGPIHRLVERDDLLGAGIPRHGNNVAESYYLYFDGELSIVLFKVPTERPVQPHDHGVWEILFVYRGALEHTVYERVDDGSVAGRAVLRDHQCATLHPGDCAVVISNSGRSRDLLDAAEIARRKGATTILITASGSPLAQTAQGGSQILLAVDHPEDYDRYSPMVSRLLHLMVIDILTTAVALRLPGELRPMLQEIKKNLRAKRYTRAEPD